MKKKVLKAIWMIILIAAMLFAIYNLYVAIVSGEQYITITTPKQAYTNSDLNLLIKSRESINNLDVASTIKLLDSNGHKVKNAKVKKDGNVAVISVPDVESGTYTVKAKVSTKKGKDTIEKHIYISKKSPEDVLINLDKGIYKPGDTVNYRALILNKDNQEPVSEDVNISIFDGNDNRVYNENVTTSEYGIVSGTFSIANEVNSGLYRLVVKSKGDEHVKQFKVNPYVTPKYEVSIKCDKDSYMVNDTAKISINAKYFFGEPVKEADLTIFIDGAEYKKVKTDENGVANIEYAITKDKEYTIRVEAVDSSNYYIEKTNTFMAVADKFKVQLYSEYNNKLIPGNNNIYVLTSNNDGTPLEAYVTITSDNYTKQIATNKDGVGSFSIDVDSNKTQKSFGVVADDKKGNIVNKDIPLNVDRTMVALSTDKIKYNQGDDINIKIKSMIGDAGKVCVFHNNQLIKMIETDSDSLTLNLGDMYGLIDFCILAKDNYGYSTPSNLFSKTIFIKPSKELSIGVSTNKEEYKPGEKISISFDAKDESDSKVDAALLVSMLDNSILSLAQNDLSIDNIKLALQDIKFSDEIDAATLYSCIVNDASEQTMTLLLLKQKSSSLNVEEYSTSGYEQEEMAILKTIISAVIIAVLLFAYSIIKSSKVRNVLKHLPNIIALEACVISLNGNMRHYYIYSPLRYIPLVIIVLFIYILIVEKIKIDKKIFKTSFLLCTAFPILLLLVLLTEEFGSIVWIIASSICASVLLILLILYKLLKEKKTKIAQKIWKIMLTILDFIRFMLILLIVVILVETIYISVGTAIILIYILDYVENLIINKITKTKTSTPEAKTITEEKRNQENDSIIWLVFPLIGLVILGLIGFMFISSMASNSISEAGSSSGYPSVSEYDYYTGGDAATKSRSDDWFDSTGSAKKSFVHQGTSNGANKSDSTSTQVTSSTTQYLDNKVRNLFLESMCFVPELIINNGSGKLDLELSDNITTWTIQTVGNTKDGRIGYGILDTVKVSKEFFVDFELPKNMVEGDKVSIPVTVYNYTNNAITTNVNIPKDDWFTTDNTTVGITINPQSTNMVYIPITVLKAGNNKFRTEVSYNALADIVEKECTVTPNGYKIEKVVSTGSVEDSITEDVLFLDDMVPNTSKAKVKIYKNTISKTIEGMDKIFKMPTGCFEQVSSSLYPNIVALKYMEDNKIIDEKIKEKALSYISSGYQKLLTYEVQSEKGGYSLYGSKPAETVLTAYGLMEITDLSEVYSVDEKVINNMNEFLYKKKKTDGSFDITGQHVGGANSREKLALNAYIVWALSESNPKDNRLNKSIDYLKENVDKAKDNYTLALIANALVNTKDKDAKNYMDELLRNIKPDGNMAFIDSTIKDYYGSRTSVQNSQTVALTSMALSKSKYKQDINKLLINYLMNKVDSNGTWYSTQSTVLSLKALNTYNSKDDFGPQTIKVKMNSSEEKIEVKENSLDYYEASFDNLNKENKLSIEAENGDVYYEVVEEYYVPYDKVKQDDDKIEVKVECNNILKVNEILTAKIEVINRGSEDISNGMITISIPQGFVTMEDSLDKLVENKVIEKYETSYNSVNIYIRDYEPSQVMNLEVKFRASYPVDVTGMAVRAYDYYNPTIEGKSMPVKINVIQ